MKKACLVVDATYANDRIFDLENKHLNRDNCLYMFSALRSSLRKQGFELRTQDLHRPADCDLIVFNEVPSERSRWSDRMLAHSVLMIYESELIRPDNWDTSFHRRCALVVTWSDPLIRTNESLYVKGGFAHQFPEHLASRAFSDRKLCTLISGNKAVSHPLELYSSRRRAIRWFETHAASEFDYFGVGWERPYLQGGIPTRALRKLGLLQYLPKRPSPCYRGLVDSKLETLAQYKFSICFENGHDIDGYITEKIFDSFFAGCIPIYWGAGNIEGWIPASCFIDFRQFLSPGDQADSGAFEKLYRFLKGFSASDYQAMCESIEAYLKSHQAAIFDADRLAETITEAIDQVLQAREHSR